MVHSWSSAGVNLAASPRGGQSAAEAGFACVISGSGPVCLQQGAQILAYNVAQREPHSPSNVRPAERARFTMVAILTDEPSEAQRLVWVADIQHSAHQMIQGAAD